MKKIVYLVLIVLLFSTIFVYQANAETNNGKNSRFFVNFGSKIFGTVKESVTCIPSPLPSATVTAIKTNLLGTNISYSTTTDENGEYQLNVEPGKYIVFAHKSGYRQINPKLWYTVNIVSGQEINCSFILIEKIFYNSYYTNSKCIHSNFLLL